MIQSLHISNYALIDSLDIEFHPGFNIITGETGAGKSIILGALSLLLGGRADLRAIRNAEAKSIIEAYFTFGADTAVASILADQDLADGTNSGAILRRELLPGGRSRAFVNDTPVNLQELRRIALNLVDIHSQHSNMQLADPEFQLHIVDTLSDNAELLSSYRQAYTAYRQTLKKYTTARDTIARTRDDRDFIAYQYQQLNSLNLSPGETQALESERFQLENALRIKELMDSVTEPLCGNNGSNALDNISGAIRALNSLTELYTDKESSAPTDTDWQTFATRLESARMELKDIASSILREGDALDADPARLEETEQRLSRIYSLQTRHHLDSPEQLIALEDRLGNELAALDDSNNILARLETEARRAKKAAAELAADLSARRGDTAVSLARELQELASGLGMPNLRCEISLSKSKLTSTGADSIQFLFAFNKNQSLTAAGDTASGGEISRIMLCLKSILAARMSLPTIIFDEVDTGVSGDIAARMASMMSHISRSIQVITITHLPAVAAAGQRHFKVYKEDNETTTTTRIRLLDEDQRVAELALMLGGDATETSALQAARTLINNTHTSTAS